MSKEIDDFIGNFIGFLAIVAPIWVLYPFDVSMKWSDKIMVFPATCSAEFQDGECKEEENIEAPYFIRVNYADRSIVVADFNKEDIFSVDYCEIFDLNNFDCGEYSFWNGLLLPVERADGDISYSITEWRYKFYHWEDHLQNMGKWL